MNTGINLEGFLYFFYVIISKKWTDFIIVSYRAVSVTLWLSDQSQCHISGRFSVNV